MRERNWGLINNGATFEALARTLVFFEDPEASLFGRPGKDGGQDMRSGDEKRVFQAKYNREGSASKAIRDAKAEAGKIAKYRTPGHERHDQWRGVEQWRLVTNALFNPTDRQRWKAEVAPLFAGLGLSADYWSQSNLDALLDRHPEVDRSFFQNEIRVLLTLPEAYDRLVQEEPFLRRDELGDFMGRERELSDVDDFIASDCPFLVIEGPGGAGKTRFLFEAGRQVVRSGTWQVFWANIASMSLTGTWFEAIVPERPTLLLVDGPENTALLQVLMEQLGKRVGRTTRWKVIVAVRSTNDPVLTFLFSPRVHRRVKSWPLNPLPVEKAKGMCHSLFKSGPLCDYDAAWLESAASQVARHYCGYPVWITLAVDLLENHQDLTLRRVAITDMLTGLAVFQPAETVEFSKTMRKPVATEKIEGPFGSRQVSHDDVIHRLAWLVYHAVPGAASPKEREQVLEELCRLAELEADIDARLEREPANDGKRAAQLIKRTLEGEPSIPHDFEDAVRAVAARQLERVAHQPPTGAVAAMLKALLDPAVSVERRQVWVEGYTFRVRRSFVTEGHPAWETRQSLLDRVKGLLESDSTPRETRVVLWRVFAEAHRSIIRCRGEEFEGFYEQMRAELLGNLEWSHGVLAGRDTGLNEFRAARDMWEWHCRLDEDAELKRAGRDLEHLYLQNGLASEFEPLFNLHEWESTKERIKEKAKRLADSGSPDQIPPFIHRAEEYLGKNNFHRVLHIARILGSHASTKKAVQDFVRESMADVKASDTVVRFGYAVAVGWVEAIRELANPDAAFDVVRELLGACSSDQRRLDLLTGVYGEYPPQLKPGDLAGAEHDYIRSLGPLFMQNGRGPDFVRMVGWTLNHDWRSFRNVLEKLLEDIPAEELTIAVGALIDTVYWAISKADPVKAPDELGPWLLNQLMRLPNLPSRNDAVHWSLKEIVKRVGRVPLSWLPDALKKRRDSERMHGYQGFCAMSYKAGWGDLVAGISADTADNPEIKRAVHDLVSLMAGDEGTIRLYLPELLRDIDPGGCLVPMEVADRIRAADEIEEILRLAEIGGHYGLGSEAWRTIAGPVMEHAAGSAREKHLFFHCLAGKGISTWSGKPGEVPSCFIDAVGSARKLQESEKDSSFMPFWEWHLEGAEAELREQEEQAKEERGE